MTISRIGITGNLDFESWKFLEDHMNKLSKLLALTAIAFVITACGTTTSERGISGAGLGAAAGAAGAALTGGAVGTGAAIGAAAGGAAGALTDEDDVDLGKPAWK
jgi:hypothetical protein